MILVVVGSEVELLLHVLTSCFVVIWLGTDKAYCRGEVCSILHHQQRRWVLCTNSV